MHRDTPPMHCTWRTHLILRTVTWPLLIYASSSYICSEPLLRLLIITIRMWSNPCICNSFYSIKLLVSRELWSMILFDEKVGYSSKEVHTVCQNRICSSDGNGQMNDIQHRKLHSAGICACLQPNNNCVGSENNSY